MTTQILHKLDDTTAAAWLALWKSSPHLATTFNTPVWLEAAESAFGAQELALVVIYEHNDLVAVAAFNRARMYGIRTHVPVALEFADKPTILIDWTHAERVTQLMKALSQLGVVYMPELTTDIKLALEKTGVPLLSYDDDQNSIVSLVHSAHGDLSHDSIAKIHKRISKSEHPVSMEYSGQRHEQLLTKAYEIERDSTKAQRGMGVFGRAQVRQFFEYLAHHAPELVELSVMNLGDKPIAFSIDFLAYGIYQGSQKAYVSGYEYYQPGKYLVMKLLEHNHELGRPAFDFGRGYDNFKMQFTHDVRPLYTVLIAKHPIIATYISAVRKMRHRAYDALVSNKILYNRYKALSRIINM